MNKLFENEKINESVFLNVSEIPFDEKWRSYCSANLCGRYGTTWNCPPAAGTLKYCMKHAQGFAKAFVFTHSGKVDGFSDNETMDALRNETMDILFDICKKLENNNISFQALGCGSCNECKKCTYPDFPCRFPERAVPPVESYGIDVASLAQSKGLTYFAGDGTVTFFCIILYDE